MLHILIGLFGICYFSVDFGYLYRKRRTKDCLKYWLVWFVWLFKVVLIPVLNRMII